MAVIRSLSTAFLLAAAASLFGGGSAWAQGSSSGDDAEMSELPERASSVSSAVTVQETDLQISPADELDIEVFQVEELSGLRKVNSRGEIRMPLIGSIKVGGLTITEAEELITSLLGAEYLVDPEVNIDIAAYASQEVTVLGAVGKPGVYELEGPTTLLQAIAMAGGIGQLADQEEVIVFRKGGDGGVVGYIVDFRSVVKGQLRDPLLAGNDRVVVPESGGKSLYSEVSRTLRGFVRFENYDIGTTN